MQRTHLARQRPGAVFVRRAAWDTIASLDDGCETTPYAAAAPGVTAALANGGDDAGRRILLAERDAARRERTVAALHADLAKMERKLVQSELEAAEYLRQIQRLEHRIGMLFASPSWRWTAPVRRVIGIVNRLRASLGGKAPAVLPGPPPPKDAAEVPEAALSLRERAILHRLHRAG